MNAGADSFGVVTILLLRHAHAGSRSRFLGPDDERPLSDKGWAQTRHIADLLEHLPLHGVYSSPYLRCVQTVEGLAASQGLEVHRCSELAEGADPKAALRLLETFAARPGENVVLCSHGDVIPAMMRRLAARADLDGSPSETAKGSLWELHTEDGAVVRGRYHPAGTAAPSHD